MVNQNAFEIPYLYDQLIPYLGNKRKLLPLIKRALDASGVTGGTFLDLFAGSGVVSRLAKTLGFAVTANDWEPYSAAINGCYIANNRWDETQDFTWLGGPDRAFVHLNGLPPALGYASEHWCPDDDENPDVARERMFFTQENGRRIDSVREELTTWQNIGAVSPREVSAVLASLVYAASYVSNTSGLFNGFHNGWGGKTGTALYRIRSRMTLALPRLCDNGRSNEVLACDAQVLAETGRAWDVAYLDPPYNQHPYGSNYHILNSLVLWDKPEVSADIKRGEKSAIRQDWKTARRSLYTYKSEATGAFTRLVGALRVGIILVSYSTEGLIPLGTMVAAMGERGAMDVVFQPYKRYRVSSQRASAKAHNIEFVLILDTRKASRPGQDAEILAKIYDAEAQINGGTEDG